MKFSNFVYFAFASLAAAAPTPVAAPEEVSIEARDNTVVGTVITAIDTAVAAVNSDIAAISKFP